MTLFPSESLLPSDDLFPSEDYIPSITITRLAPAGTIVPFMLLDAEIARPSRSIVHEIIGSATPAVTLAAAGSRAGSYTFLCRNRADAVALEAFHASASMYSLVDSEQPSHDMTYVLAEGGSIRLAIDPVTRLYWTVTIDVQGLS